MHTTQPRTAGEHPTTLEHNIAIIIVLWVILAGVCVVLANAWAASLLLE